MTTIFTEEDYNSNDGMSPLIWGPLMWNYLHISSFNYPVNPSALDKKNKKNFVSALSQDLPCKACRENLANNLEKIGYSDDVFENRETYSRFIYNLHNQVNKELKKPITLSYEEVRDRYEHFRGRCLNDVPVLPRHNHTENDAKSDVCDSPYYGKKSKCIISIVPNDSDKETFNIDKSCIIRNKVLRAAKSKKTFKSKNSKSKNSKLKNSKSKNSKSKNGGAIVIGKKSLRSSSKSKKSGGKSDRKSDRKSGGKKQNFSGSRFFRGKK
jgi:hypothetical protein